MEIKPIKPYEIEVLRKVFDNENGGYISVGPDRDGLGLIEIRDSEDAGLIIIPPAHAIVLAEAIKSAAQEML